MELFEMGRVSEETKGQSSPFLEQLTYTKPTQG